MSANSKLAERLLSLHRQKFTGTLKIKSPDRQQWKLFFYLGKFLWAEGGIHRYRSWRRHIVVSCPNLDTSLLVVRDTSGFESPIYYVINILLERKIIQREQVKALIEGRTKEVFFDLLQKEYRHSLAYKLQPTSSHELLKDGFNMSLAYINIEQMLFLAQQQWAMWGSKGLASCSPNLAPLLKNDCELGQKVPDVILQNMLRLLNGKNTLRDLAVKMDKDVFEVTCAIVPYFFKGYLRLLEIGDLRDFNAATSSSKSYFASI